MLLLYAAIYIFMAPLCSGCTLKNFVIRCTESSTMDQLKSLLKQDPKFNTVIIDRMSVYGSEKYVFGKWCKRIYSFEWYKPSLNYLSFKSIWCKNANDMNIQSLKVGQHYIKNMMPDEVKYFQRLNMLEITNGDIPQIYQYMFSEASVVNLNLSGNKISSIEEQSFSFMANLDTLNISDNSLKSIPANMVNGTRYLRILDLSHNKLRALPDGLLLDSRVIKEIYLQNNLLVEFNSPKYVNRAWQSLETLNLADNRISFIYMKSLDLLTTLYIQSNNISYVAPDVIPFNQLNAFSVFNNPLLCQCRTLPFIIDYIAFVSRVEDNLDLDPLTKKDLKVASCASLRPIKIVPLIAVIALNLKCDLSSLARQCEVISVGKTLICSWTSTKVIQDELSDAYEINNILFRNVTIDTAIDHPSMCQMTYGLTLEDCNVSILTSEVLGCFTEVRSLYLSRNSIRDVAPRSIPHSSNLSLVDLSQNSIPTLLADTFANTTGLRTLNLSANVITFLDDRIFSNLTLLNFLDLSFNRLQTVSFVANLTSLKYLIIHNNLISLVPNILFQTNYFTVSGNPLKCTLKDMESISSFMNNINKINDIPLNDQILWHPDYTLINNILCSFECQYNSGLKQNSTLPIANFDKAKTLCKEIIVVTEKLTQPPTELTKISTTLTYVKIYTIITTLKPSPDLMVGDKEPKKNKGYMILSLLLLLIILLLIIAIILAYKYWQTSRLAQKFKREFLNYRPEYPYEDESKRETVNDETSQTDGLDLHKKVPVVDTIHSSSNGARESSNNSSLSNNYALLPEEMPRDLEIGNTDRSYSLDSSNEDSFKNGTRGKEGPVFRNGTEVIEDYNDTVTSPYPLTYHENYNYDDLATSGYDVRMVPQQLTNNVRGVDVGEQSSDQYPTDDSLQNKDSIPSPPIRQSHFAMYRDRLGEIFPRPMEPAIEARHEEIVNTIPMILKEYDELSVSDSSGRDYKSW